jgi:hypothetical protein
MFRRRSSGWTVAGAVALLVGSLAGVSGASEDSDIPTSSCDYPLGAPADPDGRDPDGASESERWLIDGQPTNDGLNALLEGHDEVLLGVVPDFDRHALVVVLTENASADGVSRLTNEIASRNFDLEVVIERGCNSKEELQGVMDALATDPRLRELGAVHGSWIAPGLSKVAVIASTADAAEHIARTFGDLVSVAVSTEMGRNIGGRTNDSSPHYGDANIYSATTLGCSSNFTLVSVFSFRFNATAGHCDGTHSGGGGVTYFSGPHTFGASTARHFPNPDMQGLHTAGQNYTNVIYVNGGTISVTGKVDIGQNGYACVGGAFSGVQCFSQIISTNAQFCDASGCTTNLHQTYLAGSTPDSVPGDSGGVVFQLSGLNALGAGLIVAGTTQQAFGGYTTWYHTMSAVESTLAATLLTSP